MTYSSQDNEGIVVIETKPWAGIGNGDYLRLGDGEPPRSTESLLQCSPRNWNSLWWWVKVVLLGVFLCSAAVPIVIFAGPWIIKKVVVPILDWERATFSRTVLGLLLFACIALFPTMLLPSSPFMWIAGTTFGYGYGFLLILAGSSRWLEKWPKKAAIVRLAGEGDWFHQFRAVILLRISPFPYIIFNYAAVVTNIKYGPYISGSVVGTIHDIFITIYSGNIIRSLADAANTGGFLSVQQIIYDGIGFSVAAAATAAITIYAKRTLQNLQVDELS